MNHESKTTTDHEEIKKWAEERGGKPAIVKGTDSLLRIDFPGGAGSEQLEVIDWETFFKLFDNNKLAFLYQEHKVDGEMSTFFKLVNR